jgi:hypothetical protein
MLADYVALSALEPSLGRFTSSAANIRIVASPETVRVSKRYTCRCDEYIISPGANYLELL